MRLAFWRRPEPVPAFDYLGWSAGRLAEARKFHAELRALPEPLDVMRQAMELPDRWQWAICRAWQRVLALAAAQHVPDVHPARINALKPVTMVVTGTMTWPPYRLAWNDPCNAHTGNPIHDEALRNAKRPRPRG